jgi:hypothetical protein
VGFGSTSEWVIRGPYDCYIMVGWRCLPYVVKGLGQAPLFAIFIYYRLLLAAGVREGGEDAIGSATESSPLLQGSWVEDGVADKERLEKLTNTPSLGAASAGMFVQAGSQTQQGKSRSLTSVLSLDTQIKV